VVQRWTARRNDAEWTRLWAEVEPEWSGRMAGPADRTG
jgi:hypothetical protein